MKNKVLYFPYINVPETEWLTRMLLYWDEVGAIVPYEFIEKPERLSPHMQSLVKAELVRQVIPGIYVYDLPSFEDSFLDYMSTLGSKIDNRRKQFKKESSVPIHMEKMRGIGKELAKMGLATPRRGRWCEVESQTANEFMAYLAACLGQVDRCNSIPITEDTNNISQILYSSMPEEMEAEERVAPVRLEILENIFPSPSEPLSVQEIQDFKGKYGQLLSDFRISIEKRIIDISAIPDPALEKRALEIHLQELSQDVEEIREAMSSRGWTDIVFGKISSIAAAIPGASPVIGIINAVYSAFSNSDNKLDNSPLWYAAHAQEKLLDPKGVVYHRQDMQLIPTNIEHILQQEG